jgi:transcriptional regulator with XRE-family HTH domain
MLITPIALVVTDILSLESNLIGEMREYMIRAIDFSKMLDVKKSTYSQWENGLNNPTLEKAFETFLFFYFNTLLIGKMCV